jgi:mannose-1-phosphate guanylyltransferase
LQKKGFKEKRATTIGLYDSGKSTTLESNKSLWEKPSPAIARHVMRAGGLWNSFIMGGRVRAFLEMMRRRVPHLLVSFASMWAAVQPGTEAAALDALWSSVPASAFSHEVLAVCPSDLAVFPVEGLGWTGLGEPERVLSALNLPLGPIRSTSPARRAAR